MVGRVRSRKVAWVFGNFFKFQLKKMDKNADRAKEKVSAVLMTDRVSPFYLRLMVVQNSQCAVDRMVQLNTGRGQ